MTAATSESPPPTDALCSTLYDELHTMVRRELSKCGARTSLGATTLLRETFLDIAARLAQVVDLKFLCGFSFGEMAAMQNVSERAVQRDWEKPRIHLHQALTGTAG